MRARVFISSLLFVALVIIGNRFAIAVPNSIRIVTAGRGAQNPTVSPDGSQIALSIFGKVWLLPISGGAACMVAGRPVPRLRALGDMMAMSKCKKAFAAVSQAGRGCGGNLPEGSAKGGAGLLL